MCSTRKYCEIIVKDNQTSGVTIMVSFNGKLKDYQKDGREEGPNES